jgi:hypothetical protein
MFLEKAVLVLNQMVSDDVISDYVIGGAMGALFYTEPFETYDLDIFVAFPEDKIIVTLDPIYDYLKGKGYTVQDEHIMVEGIPVQILPIYDELIFEAATEALPQQVGQQTVRVMRPEHLLAIMTKLSRPKDKIRVHLVLNQADVDMLLLHEILSRYGLTEKWRKISSRG